MDKIYLIRDGQIKESGSHEELLKLNGIYNEMFTTQKKLYQKHSIIRLTRHWLLSVKQSVII